MKKIINIFCFLFCSTLSLLCQDLYNGTKTVPELTTPNSDTYSLGRYGEIPMNPYTGIANITVPLQTLDFNGLPIPLNLTYNTSTPKVDQEASWVGLGWTLSCEPIITRQIKGNSDIDQSGIMTGGPFRGYIYTNTILPEYGGPVPNELNEALELYSYKYTGSLGWDTEPDIFTANIFGETVSFIFMQKPLNNNQIGIKLINGSKRYKVTYNETNQTFTLINENGFQFFFTEKEYSIVAGEEANGYTGRESSPKSITGWKLSKIVAPNGKVLTYTYEYLVTQSQPKKNNSQYVSNTPTLGGRLPQVLYKTEFNKSSYLLGYVSYFLKKISSDQFSVNFLSSERIDMSALGDNTHEVTNLTNIIGFSKAKPAKLDNVIISDYNTSVIKNYNFKYSYFNNNQIEKQTKAELKRLLRLKLDQIDLNNTSFRQFSYINSNELPNKTLRYDDFWGYYNGPAGHSLKIYPSLKSTVNIGGKAITLSVDGDNRFPNFQYAKAGLLEKVTYPTGGYTILQYEPNSISVDKEKIAEFTPLGYGVAKEITITSQSIDDRSESSVFEILEDSPINTVIKIEFGTNGDYILANQYSHIKYNVEEKDKGSIAYQLINTITNTVIDQAYFTQDGNIGSNPLAPTSSTNWNILTRTLKLPKGKYKINARGLKHISNFFDKNDGAPDGHKDYGKQYNYMVRASIKISNLSFASQYNIEIGGGRIKTISNYDKNNTLLTQKSYKYVSLSKNALGDISSGVMINQLIFSDFKSIAYEQGPSGDQLTPSSAETLTVYSDNLSESESSHIGYSRVEEMSIDKTNSVNNGMVVSEFINSPNVHAELIISGNTLFYPVTSAITGRDNTALIPVQSYSDINGKLKKETFFNDKNNMIRESIYNYNYESIGSHNISHTNSIATGVKQYIVKNFEVIGGSSVSSRVRIYIMQIYKIISDNILLASKTDIDYLNGTPISRTTFYQYNNHYQPILIKELNSKGIEKEESSKYVVDFNSSSPYKEMFARNILSPIIEKQEKQNNKESIVRTNYGMFNNLYLPTSTQTSLDGVNNLRTDITYNQYDFFGNLTQYTTKEGLSTIYLWSHSGQYPIAEIKNATYNEVNNIININNLSNKLFPEDNDYKAIRALESSLKDALITTYTYKPLVGMTSMTDPRGVVTTYEYDAFGRLAKVKDANGKVINSYDYHYQNQ